MKTKQAFNPYLPSWEYIPDGEPYVFQDRVYIYGSHDLYNGWVFCLGDYVTWSAPVDDLGNWRYEGTIYHKTDDPYNRDGSMCLYAPDVTVGPDGRYYLYYVLDHKSVVSVAVSEGPAGPFAFYGYVHYADGTLLGEREGDEPQFDPGVLTEDGKTYLYTGFAGNHDNSRHGAMLTVLDSDMLTVLEAPVIIAPGDAYSQGTEYEGHAFFEAPSIRKRNGIYYFIYSSEVMHELCYAMADSPRGPFHYGGVIVSNCDIGIAHGKTAGMPVAYGANNHGSMVQIGDDWYIFYHRQTNGTWYSRQGCAEKLHFREDGSIEQVEITSCGLNGGPLSGKGWYPGYLACNLFTDEPSMYVAGDKYPRVMQDGRDGDENEGYVAGIRNSTVIGFKYFDLRETREFTLRTRGYGSGTFEIALAWDGPAIARLTIEYTDIWKDYTATWDPAPSGITEEALACTPLYLRYQGPGWTQLSGIELA